MTRYRPISRDGLITLLAERINLRPGVVRVAIDGPPCAVPHELAAALLDPLRTLGRPVHLVHADTFWHDASLRLEYGREDADSYLSWLDAPALRREVLDPAMTAGWYLPTMRDPATNRATREPPRAVEPNAVLVVSGELLLGLGLPFELTVHLALSSSARARRTAPELAWTLPAYDRYDAEVVPQEQADVVVRLDDPDRPAVRT